MIFSHNFVAKLKKQLIVKSTEAEEHADIRLLIGHVVPTAVQRNGAGMYVLLLGTL